MCVTDLTKNKTQKTAWIAANGQTCRGQGYLSISAEIRLELLQGLLAKTY